jgi:hypothetical protein
MFSISSKTKSNLSENFFVFLILTSFSFLLLSPSLTMSQTNPSADTSAGKTGIVYECGDNTSSSYTAGNCTFYDLVAATKKVINVAIEYALFFSVVVIAFAGFKYMKSGDNPGERKKANDMLKSVAIGIGWILAAWLIVTLITNTLLGSGINTFLK